MADDKLKTIPFDAGSLIITDSEDMLHFTISQPMLPTYIQIGEIKIILETGKIEFPEGMDVDEASRTIWEAIGLLFKHQFRR